VAVLKEPKMLQQKIKLPYLLNGDLPYVIRRDSEGELRNFVPKMLQ